ncbi:hypothetical protein MNBD_IGNAVI01-595 [hydrothermal vent metagenome]|uniref:Lipoprotein n=1 Tax=hydrothermal vent metagenome TaxID=652676 RepID=A0A3B1C4M3_9ZZZZ
MRKILYATLLSAIVAIGCSQTPQEMYSGNWKLKFNGDLESEFDFTIKNDLTFSFAKNITVQGLPRDVFISGEVIEDGTLNGSIFADGSLVGNISGSIAPETGTGVWEGGGLEGTWTAEKKKE